MELLEQYNYGLSKYSNTLFSKKLNHMLKSIGLFNDETRFTNNHNQPLMRYECISVHSGRDAFCTLLVQERVPLNEIVKYTGHKSIKALKKYIDQENKPKTYTNELIYKP